MTRGRQSEYSQFVTDEICRRIADGESLRSICRDEDMPSAVTVFKWLDANPDFAKRYARAREVQADALVEEAIEIVDDGTNDWMEKQDKDGNNIGWQLNGEAVARSRLRAEQRRWWAGKLNGTRYGDKQLVEHSGSIDIRIKDMSREEIMLELQNLALKGAPVPNTLLSAPVIDAEFEDVVEQPEDDWSDLA